ncbi:hypothetical protein [Cytobacillus firmus]
MLDGLLREPKLFWETFYEDRDKEIPFFKVTGPDENLSEYIQNGLQPGKGTGNWMRPGKEFHFFGGEWGTSGCHRFFRKGDRYKACRK